MVLQLKDLFDRAGEKQSFEYDLDLSHLRHGAGHALVKPVHIIGTVENRTGIVTLGYLAMFTLNTLCDRCLTPVERDLSMNFEHILVHELAGEDEDCKGLCPKCGTNLNESTCNCSQEKEVDSRLSVLLTLLDENED